MSLYCFAKVNCGYKPPELVDTSDPTECTFGFNDFVRNTCASGVCCGSRGLVCELGRPTAAKQQIDLKLIVLNQLSLMGICLTPFTASLLGKNYNNPIAFTLFAGIFFLVSLTLCWMYAYIAKHYLKETYNKKSVLKNVKLSHIIAPTFYLTASIVCWFNLTISFIILLLIPIIFLFPLDKEMK